MTNTPMFLGRLVQHDPRSLDFPVPVTGATPKNVLWDTTGDALNQGETSSCTGNAMSAALNSLPIRKDGDKLFTEEDALQLYSLATQLDDITGNEFYHPAQQNGNTGTDEGSTGLGVAKAAQQLKYITSYQHAFGFDHASLAIQQGALIVGTNWYADMFNPDSNGLVQATGDLQGGHEYLFKGIDFDQKLVHFRNSWGPSWGVNGEFSMTFDTFTKLLNEDGDLVLPVR